MKPSYADHALVFKALSDPTRLQILDMLSCGELCACDILEAFRITQPTLSYHMKILVDSGLVSAKKEGVWTNYRQQKERIEAMFDFLTEITQATGSCICHPIQSKEEKGAV